ncbi:hypothetical protein PoB_000291800 [Plakobranchus ocellatus]|uniref:Uncharacterized protein n=1 Tax=Plakobranchus ocellatus TaxID=259542 RepID=A0AAV3Y194_9GAST|nr:hypothetical protein PoB_000291800 [Plakobranchus ocellatus]
MNQYWTVFELRGGAVAYLAGRLTTRQEVRGSNPSQNQVSFSMLPCVHTALNGVARSLKIRSRLVLSDIPLALAVAAALTNRGAVWFLPVRSPGLVPELPAATAASRLDIELDYRITATGFSPSHIKWKPQSAKSRVKL